MAFCIIQIAYLRKFDTVFEIYWVNFGFLFKIKVWYFWGKLNCPIATVLEKAGLDFATRPRAGPGVVWSGIFSYTCSFFRDFFRSSRVTPPHEEQFSIKVLFRRPKVHRMHHGTPQKRSNRPARATLALWNVTWSPRVLHIWEKRSKTADFDRWPWPTISKH